MAEGTRGVVVRDCHASGLHDATPEQWRALDEVIADQGTQIAAFTERRRKTALPGWRSWVPTDHGYSYAAECVVIWLASFFDSVALGAEQVTSKTFRRGNGKSRPGVWATWVVLEDVHGLVHLRIVLHFPSSVQDGLRWSRKVARVAAWAAAARGVRRLRRRLRRHYKPDVVTVSFDDNVDLLRKVWRTVVNSALGGRVARLLAPKAGTHGSRAIDGFVSNLRGDVVVGDKVEGFDHHPIFVALRRRVRRATRRGASTS